MGWASRRTMLECNVAQRRTSWYIAALASPICRSPRKTQRERASASSGEMRRCQARIRSRLVVVSQLGRSGERNNLAVGTIQRLSPQDDPGHIDFTTLP